MTVIDDYFKDLSVPQRAALERVRELIHQTAPDAEEVITYAMPGFRYKGKYLISFSAFKDHLSIFPGAEPVATMKDELKAFKTFKGTIQFTIEKPLSDDIIKQLILIRVNDIDQGKRY